MCLDVTQPTGGLPRLLDTGLPGHRRLTAAGTLELGTTVATVPPVARRPVSRPLGGRLDRRLAGASRRRPDVPRRHAPGDGDRAHACPHWERCAGRTPRPVWVVHLPGGQDRRGDSSRLTASPMWAMLSS